MVIVALAGAVAIAVVVGIWLAAGSGATGLRRSDSGTLLALTGVLALPLRHRSMAFEGFGLNPRHDVGDSFAASARSRSNRSRCRRRRPSRS